MATEAVEAAACCYGGDNWSRPAMYRDGESSQAFCISKLADHGSISFGRYESEGLAWEKFSVFSPNRRKEDLEKSTAPGLVAQKKAYFEEYFKFKGFRAMKGLLFRRESGGEASSNGAEKENGVVETMDHEAATTKWGSCNSGGSSSSYAVVPIQVVEKEDNADLVSTMMGVECGKGKGDSQADHASSIGNPDTILKNGLKCSKDVNRAKQAKKPVSAKGSVASVASIPKLSSRMKRDLEKNSEGLKPSVTRSVTKKVVKEANPAKASTNTKSNHALRKLGEVQNSTASGVHVKSAREKTVSPAKTENGLVKPNVTSKSISGKLPASTQNTKGTTITGHQKRTGLTNRNCNEIGKKSLSPSGCQGGGEPENLRPKPMSTDLAANNTSKAGARSAAINTGREKKQEKGMTATNARIGREPKPSPSKATVVHKTSKANPEHKIAPSRVGLLNESKDTRQRIPTWR